MTPRCEETGSEKGGSRFIRMIRVHVEAVRSTNSAVDARNQPDADVLNHINRGKLL